jgi:hypothetical protein
VPRVAVVRGPVYKTVFCAYGKRKCLRRVFQSEVVAYRNFRAQATLGLAHWHLTYPLAHLLALVVTAQVST